MSETVGDFIVERLHAWGVRKIFGYPGDGINGLIGALNRADGKIEFIQVRHEEMAAFMASAYAKFTGELGVCMATSGPGATHLITGLYDARLDHMPVLAIAGQQARDCARRPLPAGGRSHEHVQGRRRRLRGASLDAPAQVRHLVDRAMRIALGERRVTAIMLPNDLQDDRTRNRRASTARFILASAIRAPQDRAVSRPICAARPTVLNAGEQGGDPGRRRRAATRPTR